MSGIPGPWSATTSKALRDMLSASTEILITERSGENLTALTTSSSTMAPSSAGTALVRTPVTMSGHDALTTMVSKGLQSRKALRHDLTHVDYRKVFTGRHARRLVDDLVDLVCKDDKLIAQARRRSAPWLLQRPRCLRSSRTARDAGRAHLAES